MRRSLPALLVLALALAACGRAPLATPAASAGARAQALAGESIVRLRPGASSAAYARRHGLSLVSAIGHDIYLFKGPAGFAALEADAEARWAEPNRALDLPPLKTSAAPAPAPRTRAGGPNDPLLPAQYNYAVTGADRLWGVQTGSPSVVVAVIDSGIDAKHPEFEGQLLPGWDFSDMKQPHAGGDVDGYGHGTHVAGVIGARADNGQGVAGLAPGCKLLPVRIFNNWGHSDTGSATAAVLWAVDHGAKVINASWGSPLPGQAGKDAYQYALDHDVVFVSAAGNSGKNDPEAIPFPAAYPGVIGVAATTDVDTWASFSTFGDWVSLAAPGKGILSTYPTQLGNGYRIMEGTSMASPAVAAAAALVRSQFPGMSQAQVKARLEATAKDVIMSGFDPYAGHGRVDVGRAVLDPL